MPGPGAAERGLGVGMQLVLGPEPGQGQQSGRGEGRVGWSTRQREEDYSKKEKVASSGTDAKQKTNSEQRFTSRWRPLLWALMTDLPKKDKGGEAPGTWGQKGVILIHIFK